MSGLFLGTIISIGIAASIEPQTSKTIEAQIITPIGNEVYLSDNILQNGDFVVIPRNKVKIEKSDSLEINYHYTNPYYTKTQKMFIGAFLPDCERELNYAVIKATNIN